MTWYHPVGQEDGIGYPHEEVVGHMDDGAHHCTRICHYQLERLHRVGYLDAYPHCLFAIMDRAFSTFYRRLDSPQAHRIIRCSISFSSDGGIPELSGWLDHVPAYEVSWVPTPDGVCQRTYLGFPFTLTCGRMVAFRGLLWQ